MTVQPTLHETTDLEFRRMVDTLIALLNELQRVSRRLAGLVRQRLEAQERADLDTVEHCLEVEREALLDFVLAERERVACLTEIGLTLAHRRPSRLRLAELILYLEPFQRDELLEVRERLRDVADDMDCLDAAGGVFRRQRNGRMSVFVSDGVETPDLFSETPGVEDSVPRDLFPDGIQAEDTLCDELLGESLEESVESLFDLDLQPCVDSDCGVGFDLDPELDAGLETDGTGPSNRISPYADDA